MESSFKHTENVTLNLNIYIYIYHVSISVFNKYLLIVSSLSATILEAEGNSGEQDNVLFIWSLLLFFGRGRI